MNAVSDLKANISLFWTVFAVSFLGGLAGIWWLSERLQYGVSFVVVSANDGVILNGSYRLNIWIIFLVIIIFLCLFMVCLALIRELRLRRSEDNADGAKARYEDVLRRAKNFVEKLIYTEPDYQGRIHIVRLRLLFVIEPDGSTNATRSFLVKANKPASLIEVAIEADEDSTSVEGYRDLNFRAEDATGKELDWLPTTDYSYLKCFAIFFPEILPGEEKEIRVSSFWPGYLRRVLEKGSTEFWWFHMNWSDRVAADVRIEWLYKRGFPHVITRLQGAHGASAKLYFEHKAEGMCWVYHDPQYRMQSRDLRIIVEKA